MRNALGLEMHTQLQPATRVKLVTANVNIFRIIKLHTIKLGLLNYLYWEIAVVVEILLRVLT